MKHTQRDAHQLPVIVQLLVNFVIPIIILTKFSSESQLGPTRGLLLSLALPVGFELYSLYKKRKVSYMSLLAIGGILVTGVLTLLGLDERWLAIRRSAPYLFAAVVVLVSYWIKRPVVQLLLGQITDMSHIEKLAAERGKRQALRAALARSTYAVAGLCIGLAAVSYLLTVHIIDGPAGSETFNAAYARLRLVSIPAVTLPLFVGMVALLMYLAAAIERCTGLDADTLLKKK